MIIKKTLGDRVFDAVNIAVLILLSVCCLYPMLYVIFASLSDPAELSRAGGILICPKGFQTETYKVVFRNSDILTGYANTVFLCFDRNIYKYTAYGSRCVRFKPFRL